MSTAPDAAKTSKLGNVSTNFWLGLLVLSMIVFGANTGVATWQGSRLAGAGTGAADLQVLSQQLANQGREAVAGNRAAYAALPNVQAFWLLDALDVSARIPASYVALSAAYAAAWSAAALALGLASFRSLEISG